jgi:hypothetical protein
MGDFLPCFRPALQDNKSPDPRGFTLTKGHPMKQMIVIPIETFNSLVDRCADSLPEYQTLKNGFVMRNKGGEEEVHIMCDSASAKTILAFADQAYSEAVPYIRAMSLSD